MVSTLTSRLPYARGRDRADADVKLAFAVALELDAKLRVPSYVPTGGVGDAIAEGFVTAACRALGAPSR